MKMMFVCLKTVLGREQVGFDPSLLGQEVIAILTCHSHSHRSHVLAISSEYYDR